MRKNLLFVTLLILSVLSIAFGLTACRTGGDSGKSAYELYKDNYIHLNGSEAGMLNESDWLLSLKGDTGSNGLNGVNGENGKSAYELYVEAYIKATGSEEGVLSENEWLLSLKGETGDQGVQGKNGENGKSAYELYVEAYIKAIGSEEGVLSESEWLESLRGETGSKGEDGRSIKNVAIICGDIIIYFDDDTSDTLENKLPDAGHNWNSGVITTNPTCISPGIITYTCDDCGATKKELVDADGSHRWGEYIQEEDYHWRTCKICGEVEKHEHDFGDASKDSDVNELLECECGIHKTVGEFYSYKVTFECGNGVSVRIFDTQNYENGGYTSNVAYARDSSSGELLKNEEGQVNFEVIVALGYKVVGVTASPASNYKNLKDSDETSRDNTFRLTKIKGEVIITIETEIDFLDLPIMVINTENSAPILDKENYVTCNVSVLGAKAEYCFIDAGAGIRGRGNYTWTLDKKPYKIKFKSEIDLFGNGKARKWTLIANYADPSLLRNYLAFLIGAQFESLKQTTTSVQFVELYLNGEYEGVYLVCEQNEVGETRVDIEDDFSLATNPEDMGFLLELDFRAPDEGEEDLDFIYVNDQYYAIKSPECDDADDENLDYSLYVSFIKNYLQNICEILKNKDDYVKVQELIDIDSFADSYIINELFKSCDIGVTSFFIYYNNKDGKLYCGPIWDYDISCGNCNDRDNRYFNVLYAKIQNFWYNELLEYNEFVEIVSHKLIQYENKIISTLNTGINNILPLKNSFLRNFDRWNILGTYIYPNPEEIVAIETWEGQVEYSREWLLDSLDYIISVYCS